MALTPRPPASKPPTPKPVAKPATTAKQPDGREEAWFGCGWRSW